MLDTTATVTAALEEIDLLRERFRPPVGTTTPERGKAVDVDALAPLPSTESFARVIEESFWASVFADEGRFPTFRLSYDPATAPNPAAPEYWFEAPTPLTQDSLRRLAHTHDPKYGWLSWREHEHSPHIAGIHCPTPISPSGWLPSLQVRVAAPGILDIAWMGRRVLLLKRGRILRPSHQRTHTISNCLHITGKVLGDFSATFLRRTLPEIVHLGHGGSIWIIGNGIDPNSVSFKHRTLRGASLVDAAPTFQERQPLLMGLAYLTGMDGAVVVDASLSVVGFGAFVTLDNELSAERLLDSGQVEQIRAEEVGGGRHRAALAFCALNAPAVAFVVSQDGFISFFAALKGSTIPLVIQLLPLTFGAFDVED